MNDEAAQHPPQLGRRALVLGGVGVAGLTMGASGVDVVHTLTTTPALPLVVPATEDLMTDHGLLKRILLIYREYGRRLSTGDLLDPAALFHSAQMVHATSKDSTKESRRDTSSRACNGPGHSPTPCEPCSPNTTGVAS